MLFLMSVKKMSLHSSYIPHETGGRFVVSVCLKYIEILCWIIPYHCQSYSFNHTEINNTWCFLYSFKGISLCCQVQGQSVDGHGRCVESKLLFLVSPYCSSIIFYLLVWRFGIWVLTWLMVFKFLWNNGCNYLILLSMQYDTGIWIIIYNLCMGLSDSLFQE